ncbi:DUF1294 domain-containing protein [Oribacterium sp. HCP28S3_H8]|jgi:uncharacterized membrane protein YsdA (DUF1294 family)|uniref:DUF1294 domain-containing protein n=1 Tax=Oribacterium sp. HCP28S3_H8 TaxID=3438945 RepID=UPI0030351A1B|nr:DUF1294 domain-containing protein [Oribacterium sp.]
MAGYYLILVNVLAFVLYGVDKWKARRSLWRIPEAELISIAAIGGAAGALAGMLFFHHKTRKPRFRYGIPLILILWILLILYLTRL